MSAIVLSPDPQRFPPGTSVAAYRRDSAYGVTAPDASSPRVPGIAAAETQNVAADGSLTFSTLLDNVEYIGVAAGGILRFTPGVRSTIDPGTELGAAQITANAPITGALADVVGLSVPVTTGNRPVDVIFDAQSCQISTAGNFGTLEVLEDGVQIAGAQFGAGGANEIYPVHREVRRTPAPGLHTYKVQAVMAGTIGANDRIVASAASPASLRVVAA